jgi:diacylglycerol kinase family enzyme
LERYFGNNMGLGFEAQVTLESYAIKRLAGELRYVAAALRALRRYHAPLVELCWETPDGRWQERIQHALLISLGNSPRTGGVFYLTPDAVLDDGLLDLGVARMLPRWRILMLLPKVLRGAHRNDPALELTRCRRLRLHCAETLPAHLDGEVVLRDVQQAEVEVQPGRLEVVV